MGLARAAAAAVTATTTVAWPSFRPLTLLLVLWCAVARPHGLSLKLDRATAKTLIVKFPFNNASLGNYTWEYKSLLEANWREPLLIRNHQTNPAVKVVFGLRVNMQHYIRVRDETTGTYSNELSAWTCTEQVPLVRSPRLAQAGPGWLDIRWQPAKEECLSHFVYHVRYKADHGDYTPIKTYGIYGSPSPGLVNYGPSHPCDPSEFCVLLTDKVQPGQEHTVEVQVERYGSYGEEKSEKLILTANSNVEYTGPVDIKVCADGNDTTRKDIGKKVNEEDNYDLEGAGVALPIWLLALLGTLIFVVFFTIIGISVKYSVGNAVSRVDKHQHLPRPLEECHTEERYVSVRNLASCAHRRSVQNDDNEMPLYEEIGTSLSPSTQNTFKMSPLQQKTRW